MTLREDTFRYPDGSPGLYAFVEKPDFALVVPVEREGFHMVEQYRYPVGRRSWEFPQGTLPDQRDVSAAEVARRELAEETGLHAGRLRRLGRLYPAKGMSSQACDVFLAEDLEPGVHAREQEEQDMRQAWFPNAKLADMIRAGVVIDGATVAAYALYSLEQREPG